MSRVDWDYVTDVASETEPGEAYAIKRRRSDGHLGCACMSYRFAPKAAKTCKHIDAFKALGVQAQVYETVAAARIEAAPGLQIAPLVMNARVRGETYTFTRSISFGKIPAGGRH